ncbi:hypothetical protein [Vibrio cyclitrophicus]|uniref:hypothetical protein n=1 Tax=Vibrio cyclitrophicus TaxID=47951 RepID=UPI0032E41D23
MSKTCICCQKSVNVDSSSDYLAVCGNCEPWMNSHLSLVDENRTKMIDNLNPAAKAAFKSMKHLEQGYVVLRFMEKEAA